MKWFDNILKKTVQRDYDDNFWNLLSSRKPLVEGESPWVLQFAITWSQWGFGIEANWDSWNVNRASVIAQFGPWSIIFSRFWKSEEDNE